MNTLNSSPHLRALSFPKIYKYLDSVNVKYIGPPVNLTLDWEGTSGYVYSMAALPIEKKIRPGLGFDILEVNQNPCIKLEHFGSYKTLRNAHAKLDYLFRRNNQVIDKPIIEEYVTSPSSYFDDTQTSLEFKSIILRSKCSKPSGSERYVQTTSPNSSKSEIFISRSYEQY